MNDQPRALRLNDFCRIYSLSRSSVYKLINRGTLETKVIAGRRLVPVEAAEKLFNNGHENKSRRIGSPGV